MREPSRKPEQSSGKPGQDEMRKAWGSLIAEPTAFLDLSQDFIDRLRAVAPQPRRPKLRYAAAIVAVLVVLFVAVTAINRSVVALHRTPTPASAKPSATASLPSAATADTALAEMTQAPDPLTVASSGATIASPASTAGTTRQGSSSDDPPPQGPVETARQGSSEIAPRAASSKNARTPRKPHRRAPR